MVATQAFSPVFIYPVFIYPVFYLPSVAIGRPIMPLDVAPRHFSRKLNLRRPRLRRPLIPCNLRRLCIRRIVRPRRCSANNSQLVIELDPLSVSPDSEPIHVVENLVVTGRHCVCI